MSNVHMRFIKLVVLVVCIWGSFGSVITSNATEITIEDNQRLPLEFKYNYSQLTMSQKEKDGKLEIDLTEISEGSYMYMHQDLNKTRDEYGLYISLENLSEYPLLMNVNFNTDDGNAISIDTKSNHFYRYNAEQEYRVFELRNHMLEIPAHFSGAVYLPYTSFRDDSTKEQIKLEDLTGVGFTFTSVDVKVQSFTIDAIAFLEKEQVETFVENRQIAIEVETSIPIPVMGESMELCKIVGSDKEIGAIYSVEYLGNGVEMSEDGYLTVDENAENQSVQVMAKLDNGFILQTLVDIDDTWQMYEMSEDGEKYYIQSNEEYENLGNIERALTLKEYVVFARVVFIGVGIFLVATYAYWNIQKRKSDKGEA